MIPNSIVKPLYDNVVVEIEQPQSKTESGFIIPEESQVPTYRGTIKYIGHTVKNLKVGDVVLHKKFSGIDFEMANTMYKFLKETEIVVILN